MPTLFRIVDVVDLINNHGRPMDEYYFWPDVHEGLKEMFTRTQFANDQGGYFPEIKVCFCSVQNPRAILVLMNDKSKFPAFLKHGTDKRICVCVRYNREHFYDLSEEICWPIYKLANWHWSQLITVQFIKQIIMILIKIKSRVRLWKTQEAGEKIIYYRMYVRQNSYMFCVSFAFNKFICFTYVEM